jgi:hypothetical protein
MASSNDDVSAYLAARKAKKSNQYGSNKFKTFTATQAFMAENGEYIPPSSNANTQELDSSIGIAMANATIGESTTTIERPTTTTKRSNHNNTGTALVSGEWIDDDKDLLTDFQPRLMSGNGIQDLELTQNNNGQSLMDSKEKQQFHSMRNSALEAQQQAEVAGLKPNIWGAPPKVGGPRGNINSGNKEELFPSLGSAVGTTTSVTTPSASVPVNSVWGRPDRGATSAAAAPAKTETPPPTASPSPPPPADASTTGAAAPAKPNVWKPKSQIQAAAPPSGSNDRPSPSTSNITPRSRETTPAAAAASTETDGLKRAANPWKPKKPIE